MPDQALPPAIVAHAAATVASLPNQPFTLAVGTGERLNEHDHRRLVVA